VPVIDQSARTNVDHSYNARVVLAARGFRRLLGVRLVSQFADGCFQSGLGSTILFNPDKQASPIAIATGVAILLLPYSLVGPYVGVFLDRWSRRTILFVTNLLRALLVLPAIPMIWWTGHPDRQFAEPLLVAFAFGIIGLNRFFLAGVSAAVPHVVADQQLVTANAISTTLGSTCYTIGLGSTPILIRLAVVPATSHGYATMATVAMLGYLPSALLARASFTSTALGPDTVGQRSSRIVASLVDVGRGMVGGVRHLTRARGAAYAVVVQGGFRVLFGVLVLATLLLYPKYFYRDDISKSITAIGRIFIGGGLGVLVAAFLTPPIAHRFTPLLLVVGVFFVNVAAQGIKIVVDTALQHECEDEFRGRVFSVNDTMYNLCFVGGLFLGALTLPFDGHSPVAVLLIGLGYLVLAVWYGTVASRWTRQYGDDIAGQVAMSGTGPRPGSR
jgi:hypothetical protein